MATCPACNQPIIETIAEGRKLISHVPNRNQESPEIGRFLTIYNQTCECGVRVERRYENRTLVPVGHEQNL